MTQKTLIGFTQEDFQTLKTIANEIQTKYGLPMLQILEKGTQLNVTIEAPAPSSEQEETESK